MISEMSNALFPLHYAACALSAPARTVRGGSPATGPEPFEPSGLLLHLLSAGVIVLVVVLAAWVVRCVRHSRKASLAGTPGRPNTLHPAHILALFALLIAAGLGGKWLFDLILVDKPHRLTILTALLAQIVWLAGGVATACVTFRLGLRRGLGLDLRHWKYDLLRTIVSYLAVLPVCVGLMLLCSRLLPEQMVREQHPMLEALMHVSNGWKALVAFSAIVMAPLVEEIFFRGLLQSMLRRYLQNPWLAIVLASAVFAVMHLETPQNAIPLIALSLVLGYNYERTGRLTSPILIHVLFNAVFIADSLLRMS